MEALNWKQQAAIAAMCAVGVMVSVLVLISVLKSILL
jgi:hypothetical protein